MMRYDLVFLMGIFVLQYVVRIAINLARKFKRVPENIQIAMIKLIQS